MKALSLWQPWAAAISLGLKGYETRGWSTAYRGPLAIHAAKKKFQHQDYTPEFYQEACRRISAAGCPQYALDYGKILCIVDLTECVPVGELRGRIGIQEFWGDYRDVGDDGKPRFAFKLENLRVIAGHRRTQIVGRQGFFNVPDGWMERCLAL